MNLSYSPFANNNIQKEKQINLADIKPLPKAQKPKPKCIKLTQIDLTDNQLISKKEQSKLLNSYKNTKCISGKMIKEILADLNNHYIKEGYLTTKPFLKPFMIFITIFTFF